MIDIRVVIEDHFRRVLEATKRAVFKSLGHAAAAIRKTAIESIEPEEGPSEPGTPPHTHTSGFTKKGKPRRGQLPQSIVFVEDKAAEEAIVGPRASVVGEAGAAHEFGGEFRGDDYPERPFMWPALEENIDRFAEGFQGSIGEE
jgi:phage gpG-like protein